MTINYDLHSHSTASDGSFSPSELIRHAVQQKVSFLALTDHDNTSGLTEASNAAIGYDLNLIPGIEISVTWNKQTVHVLGLCIDPSNEVLQSGLANLMEYRDWRATEIAKRLDKAGITGAYEGANKYRRGRIFSRTHFARFLVDSGHAKSIRDVFKHYLVSNKPGYVPGKWATLEECLSWINLAGGIAVIAHPARYGFTATRLRKLLSEFKDLGGSAIEVVSGSHSKDDVRYMSELATQYEFYSSCGSDFHSTDNQYINLGKIPALPDKCQAIWEHPNWHI
ncbi:FIG00031715: Predicted metal-dependent phosphoesterases (PHP family) [hydrothermal vent metagenome]|uniref:FIG00031715: Predicted metal-dependent phosphoesterases (PHP family) n=1 Tax=hydrothermal vent metagenome TaxID=652676 RepID=A0A3B1AR90_9ZZZZ